MASDLANPRLVGEPLEPLRRPVRDCLHEHVAGRARHGATLQAGYDFTLPGNTKSLTMTVSAAQVTFAVACVSGATPSASTITVPLSDQAYQITNDQWYPSGDQSSPLVYQGSVTVPDLCGGGKISLAKGGTFTATLG
jgi:hypothetical protein